MHRPALILATASALAAAAAIPAAHGAGAPAQRAAAQGTVSVTPSILETTARRGASTSTVIRNTSDRRLRFTVKPRPWRQSRSGAVTADRSRRLGGLALSTKRFKLGPGKSRRVYVTLGNVPSSGSRYGALDAVGKPGRGSGVNVAYRLVASLRFNPSAGARRHALRAGTASASGGALGVLVRNAGQHGRSGRRLRADHRRGQRPDGDRDGRADPPRQARAREAGLHPRAAQGLLLGPDHAHPGRQDPAHHDEALHSPLSRRAAGAVSAAASVAAAPAAAAMSSPRELTPSLL